MPSENLALSRLLERRIIELCPNCHERLGPAMCCFTYSEWHCWGCGARLDSRVVTPELALECEVEWPDYEPDPFDDPHPEECVCEGLGWVSLARIPTGGADG